MQSGRVADKAGRQACRAWWGGGKKRERLRHFLFDVKHVFRRLKFSCALYSSFYQASPRHCNCALKPARRVEKERVRKREGDRETARQQLPCVLSVWSAGQQRQSKPKCRHIEEKQRRQQRRLKWNKVAKEAVKLLRIMDVFISQNDFLTTGLGFGFGFRRFFGRE